MKKTVIMALLLLLILAACKNETAKEVKMKIAVIETGKGTKQSCTLTKRR